MDNRGSNLAPLSWGVKRPNCQTFLPCLLTPPSLPPLSPRISRAASVLLSDPCFQLHSIQHLLGEGGEPAGSSTTAAPSPPPVVGPLGAALAPAVSPGPGAGGPADRKHFSLHACGSDRLGWVVQGGAGEALRLEFGRFGQKLLIFRVWTESSEVQNLDRSF